MTKIIILFCLIGILSCNQDETQTIKEYLKQDFIYFKDSRTNLCFAGMGMRTYAQTITNVPCSIEVEQIIHKQHNDE